MPLMSTPTPQRYGWGGWRGLHDEIDTPKEVIAAGKERCPGEGDEKAVGVFINAIPSSTTVNSPMTWSMLPSGGKSSRVLYSLRDGTKRTATLSGEAKGLIRPIYRNGRGISVKLLYPRLR
jgi:hypothetical protein